MIPDDLLAQPPSLPMIERLNTLGCQIYVGVSSKLLTVAQRSEENHTSSAKVSPQCLDRLVHTTQQLALSSRDLHRLASLVK